MASVVVGPFLAADAPLTDAQPDTLDGLGVWTIYALQEPAPPPPARPPRIAAYEPLIFVSNRTRELPRLLPERQGV